MLYFANPVSNEVRQAMRDGIIGYIDTPMQGNRRENGVEWCADNGCFSERWEAVKWWRWIDRQERTMRFATCPDVVSDWDATRALFDEWAPRMTDSELPVAIVAQDGAKATSIPWSDISCVFIGGSTAWKVSANTEDIVQEANRRNVWAHVGRVNSYKRLKWARDIGADSADGTMLVFNPTKRLTELRRWLTTLDEVHPLPIGVGSYGDRTATP